MVESPQRIWIEDDDECPYFYEAHELHDVEQDVIEYVRADLYAALEAKLAEVRSVAGILERNIKENGQDTHRMKVNGEWHEGPAVDACRDLLVSIRQAILSALEAQPAERAGGVNEDALRALAQAYDREDAAQRGEPDPWNLDAPGDIGDSDTWVSERLACAEVAARAFLDAIGNANGVWQPLPDIPEDDSDA